MGGASGRRRGRSLPSTRDLARQGAARAAEIRSLKHDGVVKDSAKCDARESAARIDGLRICASYRRLETEFPHRSTIVLPVAV